jgi:hypothetical protein
MLKVLRPSPPVPQVSRRTFPLSVLGLIFVARFLMIVAAPAISSAVSPLSRSAVMNPPIWASVAPPVMMISMAVSISERERSWPLATFCKNGFIIVPSYPKKLVSIFFPCSVMIDSG